MKKVFTLFLFLTLQLLFVEALLAGGNPLLTPSDLPYGAPRFDQVRPEHFEEAFEVAMKGARADMEAILAVPKKKVSFGNTIIPLGYDGELYSLVGSVFSTYKGNLNTPQLSAISKKLSPIQTRFDDEMLSIGIFPRIAELYAKRDKLGLDSLQRLTLENMYRSYVRSGVLCAGAAKDSLRVLNERIALARLQHGENIVNCTDNFLMLVGDKDSLSGLSASTLAAAAATAEKAGHPGKWGFTLESTAYGNFMVAAKCRELRQKLYTAYVTRCADGGPYDNRDLSIEIINLRLQRSRILGYKTYADYAIEINMAKTPDRVYDLLTSIANPAIAQAKLEVAEVQAFAQQMEGADFDLMGWDWSFYSNLLRKDKFDTQGASTRAYFSYDNVMEGVFYTANKLYGITVKVREDIPGWHPDVTVYEVLDADSSPLGLLYIDPYSRQGKRGGAWCSSIRRYRVKDGVETLPLVTISYNFAKTPDGTPTLLSTTSVKTSFHEFGHALANFLSRGPYPSICGRFPRDMVELPSQIMEHWGREPQVMKVFARHYKTGEVIPDSLITMMKASELYNEGRATSEHMAAALLDLEWHSVTQPVTCTVDEFEEAFREKYGFDRKMAPRYRTTYFNHIFASSYPSQYYVYTWASVLDTDAFAAFTQTGDIFDRATADRFRKYILTEVSWDDGMEQYERFRGSLPSVDALLRRKGLLE